MSAPINAVGSDKRKKRTYVVHVCAALRVAKSLVRSDNLLSNHPSSAEDGNVGAGHGNHCDVVLRIVEIVLWPCDDDDDSY